MRLFRRKDEQRTLQARRLSGQDEGDSTVSRDKSDPISTIEENVDRSNDELDQIVGRLEGLSARSKALYEIDLTLDPARRKPRAGSVETLDLRTLMSVRDPDEEPGDDFDERFDAFAGSDIAGSEDDQPARRWLEGR